MKLGARKLITSSCRTVPAPEPEPEPAPAPAPVDPQVETLAQALLVPLPTPLEDELVTEEELEERRSRALVELLRAKALEEERRRALVEKAIKKHRREVWIKAANTPLPEDQPADFPELFERVTTPLPEQTSVGTQTVPLSQDLPVAADVHPAPPAPKRRTRFNVGIQVPDFDDSDSDDSTVEGAESDIEDEAEGVSYPTFYRPRRLVRSTSPARTRWESTGTPRSIRSPAKPYLYAEDFSRPSYEDDQPPRSKVPLVHFAERPSYSTDPVPFRPSSAGARVGGYPYPYTSSFPSQSEPLPYQTQPAYYYVEEPAPPEPRDGSASLSFPRATGLRSALSAEQMSMLQRGRRWRVRRASGAGRAKPVSLHDPSEPGARH